MLTVCARACLLCKATATAAAAAASDFTGGFEVC